MASTKRRYDKREFARRGDEVYEMQVCPRLTSDDEGRFAAVDIETGEYEIAEDELGACDRLSIAFPMPRFGWSRWVRGTYIGSVSKIVWDGREAPSAR